MKQSSKPRYMMPQQLLHCSSLREPSSVPCHLKPIYMIKSCERFFKISIPCIYRSLHTSFIKISLILDSRNLIFNVGIFWRRGSRSFSRVTSIWPIEVQNVFLIINYDVPDRLGQVWDIFDTLGLQKLIFHCLISWKMADFDVFKAFKGIFPY